MSTPSFRVLPLLSLVIALPACVVSRIELNPDHCANQQGDEYCAQLFPDKPYCTTGAAGCALGGRYGCVEEVPEAQCKEPCGLNSDDSCEFPTESTGDATVGSSTGGDTDTMGSSESSTTGPQPCTMDEECLDAGAPFCEPTAGECVGCDGLKDGDAACAEADANAPLCVGGDCVACTADDTSVCDALALVCDEDTNACVPCTEHDQCGEAACNLFDGTCLPADAVARVGIGQEFATIGDAVDSFGAGAQGTVIVFDGSYNEPVTIDGGRVIAFVVNEGDLPEWTRTAGLDAPQLIVSEGTVLVDGLQLSGNDSTADAAVIVDDGRAWIDRSRVVTNLGGGIVAQNAAELVLRNCFVGDGTNSANALTVDAATADVLYSSLGAGFDNFDDVFAIACSGAVTVRVRNSVLVSFDNAPGEISCSMAEVSNTASETSISGTANVELGEIMADWFVDVAAGNFHLDSPPAELTNAAVRQSGDPVTDIDGDPRPTSDGATDFAGADVP